MAIITTNELKDLSNHSEENSISIFIPTHRSGQDMLQGKDAIQLKNQLQDIRKKLEETGMQGRDIEAYLKPANDLLNDTAFWRNQSDGLAIFLSKGLFKYYTVPVHFETFNYLSGEFYLKPLMPFFNDNGKFFLLNLEVGNIHLYHCDKHEVSEIDLENDLPSELRDVVGYDYEQKTLQFRTQQGTSNAQTGSFHGHQDEGTDHKKELLQYFHKVDEGLMKVLSKKEIEKDKEPLVLACSDEHFGIYKKANSYNNLYDKHINSTLRDNDIYLLHEKVWNTVESHFKSEKKNKIEQFNSFQGTGKTSKDIRQIVPAAEDGKIDTLFLENKSDILGNYNSDKREIHLNSNNQKRQRSLMNFAAMKVFEKGGDVYLMDKEDMPNKDAKINALFRY